MSENRTGASFKRGKSVQDYATPEDFMRAVEGRFGRVTWDLAATSANTKAGNLYISPGMDSLSRPWHRLQGPLGATAPLLWLNPPFSNIAPWAQKCAEEMAAGARILFLTPASRDYVHEKARVLFLNGRITFVGQKDPYPKDCCLSCYNIGEVGFEVWSWKAETHG